MDMKNIQAPSTTLAGAVDDYVTTTDVQVMCKLKSKRAVQNWMKNGVLPFYRIGRVVRFRRSDVIAYLESFRVEHLASRNLSRRSTRLNVAAMAQELSGCEIPPSSTVESEAQ
jgi:excisionase family DNA binding protein